jgi:hypothetical protein
MRTKMPKLSGWKVNAPVSQEILSPKSFTSIFVCQVLPSSVLSPSLRDLFVSTKNVADPQDEAVKPSDSQRFVPPLLAHSSESLVQINWTASNCFCFIDREVLNALKLSLALL